MTQFATDGVTLGKSLIPHQDLWAAVDAKMPVLANAQFQGLVGVGPPRSAVTEAEATLKQVEQEVQQRKQMGEDPAKYTKVVDHYRSLAKQAESSSSVLESLGVSSYSFCLERKEGGGGYLIWNDDVAVKSPSDFVTVPVVGDVYWSADMTNVKLTIGKKSETLGCVGGRGCSAVIDTGTSVLVAPQKVVDTVIAMLNDAKDLPDDCSDLSSLPNLDLELGGEKFTLPPSAYVGSVDVDDDTMVEELDEGRQAIFSHFRRVQKMMGQRRCVPLIYPLSLGETEVDMYIMGLPFFREYYTTFNVAPDGQSGKSMSFTPSGDGCEPAGNIEFRSEAPRKAVHIPASKIRLPHWVHKNSRSLLDVSM